jgi:hypothetical protein
MRCALCRPGHRHPPAGMGARAGAADAGQIP